jgi:hypothetical protein
VNVKGESYESMNVSDFESDDWLGLSWQPWRSLNPADGDLGEITQLMVTSERLRSSQGSTECVIKSGMASPTSGKLDEISGSGCVRSQAAMRSRCHTPTPMSRPLACGLFEKSLGPPSRCQSPRLTVSGCHRRVLMIC